MRTFLPQCPLPEACIGGQNGTRSSCASGYEGVLCGVCSDGYYLQFRRCEPCPDSGASTGLFVSALVVATIAVLFLLFKYRMVLPRAPFKVLMAFMQIVSAGEIRCAKHPPAHLWLTLNYRCSRPSVLDSMAAILRCVPRRAAGGAHGGAEAHALQLRPTRVIL